MSMISLAIQRPCFPHVSVSPLKQRNLNNIISFRNFNPLSARIPGVSLQIKRKKQFRGVICLSGVNPDTLQWVSTIFSAVLMLVKGTAIHKSFLAPLIALQAPATLVSWVKGEYGVWTAFLALLVRIFYLIPGELELPFWTLLLVIVAPYQAMNLRGTQASAIVSLAIAGFLAFQHFKNLGDIKKAFDQGSLIATIGIVGITIIPCLLLI